MAATEDTLPSRRFPAYLYGVLRRATGPTRWRFGSLYLGAGMLTLRQLRAASIVRWEAYGTAESNAAAGLEDWESRVYRDVLHPSYRVLLVGCGTGRDLIELVRLGCEVVGLEQSPMLAGRAREHLDRLGLAGTVVAEPVESYVTSATYDAGVFSLYMYSYIIGTESRIAVLTRARASLSPHGRIILSYATIQPQSPVWISLARVSSVCSGSDWWPHRGDRLHGPASQPEVLNLEHQFSPDEIARECDAAGLRVIRDEAINPLFRFAIAAV
jgi:SAM-dependent methyltransferase